MTWAVVWAHLSDGPSLPGTVCFSACRHYYNWNLNDRKLVIRIYYHMPTKVTSRHSRFELKQTKRPRCNLSGSLHKGYSQHLQYLGWAVLRIAFVLRSTQVTPGSFGLFQFKSKMPAGSFSWHVVINSNYQFAAVQIPIAIVPARIPRTCRPQFEYITTCQLKYTGGIFDMNWNKPIVDGMFWAMRFRVLFCLQALSQLEFKRPQTGNSNLLPHAN